MSVYVNNKGDGMDISLNYEEKGYGNPLILLHGNGEDHKYFRSQIEYFSKARRVIAIDTRGHGASPMGKEPFSLYTFAEDLNGFMIAHKIPKTDILGFSDGGNIALIFALKHPDKVNRLVLNGANLSFSGLTLKTALWIYMKYIQFKLQAPFSERAAKNKQLFRLMVKEPKLHPRELGAVKNPTLIIVGDRDMISARHSRLIADSIPNSRLVTLSGDHFIASGSSAEFNKAVEDFLN